MTVPPPHLSPPTDQPNPSPAADQRKPQKGTDVTSTETAAPATATRTAPPSETLIRHVAGIIRERATNATPGDWGDDANVTHGFSVKANHEGETFFVAWTGDEENNDGEPTNAYADQLFIAAMQPQVGLALADWLEQIADQHPASWDSPECPQCGSGSCEHPDMLACASCLEDYPCWPAAPAFELARRLWNGIATFTSELIPADDEEHEQARAALAPPAPQPQVPGQTAITEATR